MASAEYINSLPRKIVGAAAIFFNKNKKLFIDLKEGIGRFIPYLDG
jgi:hypothetical protein